jgi:hypothetical protein
MFTSSVYSTSFSQEEFTLCLQSKLNIELLYNENVSQCSWGEPKHKCWVMYRLLTSMLTHRQMCGTVAI